MSYLLSLSEFGFLKSHADLGDILNISPGGMLLRSAFPLENGHVLRFQAQPADMPGLGQVRWVGSDGHGVLAGIRFL